jgi:aminopeptidase
MDMRWKEIAEILVNYSTTVQPNERVMIAMLEPETYPLVQAVYEKVISAGAYPQVQFLSETLRHAVMRYGNDDQINWVPEIEAYSMEWADVYFGLRGAHNLYENADISAGVLAANQEAMGKVSTMRWEKTRWCLVRVPNDSFACQSETDLETITDMFFNASLLDWKTESENWHRMADEFEQGKEVRIVGKETDLTFSVTGRKWVVGDGKINIPDGEIFTSPVNQTLNGHIYFEFPGVLSGRLIPAIRLVWENGRLIEASSSTNETYLKNIIATDEGSSLLGEFAFGTNPHINRFCKDILIDEKIGGTIHIALGRAFKECGGLNSSAIHWDIVKDLREEGTVYIDGRPVLEKGILAV